MQLKLKEDPREWQKFAWVMAALGGIIGGLLWRRGVIGQGLFMTLLGVGLALGVLAWARPRWFRQFYRWGMTVSFWIGRVMGTVLLLMIFVGVLTPLGLMLRLCGKDSLHLKKRPASVTYWRLSSNQRDLERQF